MEWEKKFYDIIQETESNLARARLKLQGKSFSKNANQSLDKLGPLHQRSTSVQPLTSMHWDSALNGQLCRSVSVTPRLHGVPRMSLHDEQTSDMGELLKRIDSQNLMIDRLERLVKTLNQEKHQYRRHITDLQHEVGDISTKLNETKYLNPHLETQVDLMRHEVRSDIHRLQNMISAARSSSLQSTGLERSFKDMQHSVHTELEALHRDLNFMTHRVGRLELDMSSHTAGQRDLHDRLNGSLLTAASAGQLGQSGHFHGSKSSADASHLKGLRSTVSELHEKLDSLEARLAASSVVPVESSHLLSGLPRLYKSAVRLNCRKCKDLDDESSDLDDLDLSDLDLSSDEDEDATDISEDLELIIKSSATNVKGRAGAGMMSSGRSAKVTLADLNLSSDDQPTVSSEGADLSDLDLDDLDLSSAGGSFDLDTDLKLDDL